MMAVHSMDDAVLLILSWRDVNNFNIDAYNIMFFNIDFPASSSKGSIVSMIDDGFQAPTCLVTKILIPAMLNFEFKHNII